MEVPITVVGARQNNLKDLTCTIPRNRLVALAGPSGAGKSTLAFDVLFAEGQRRFFEALPTEARAVIAQWPRPDVDAIDGLSPTIAIRSGGPSRSARSTLGTATEVADYLRLLFARLARPYDPESGQELKAFTVDEIADQVLNYPVGTRFVILAPLIDVDPLEPGALFRDLGRRGFVRARVGGREYELADESERPTTVRDVELVVDRLIVKDSIRGRLSDSIELALKESCGQVVFDFLDDGQRLPFNTRAEVAGRPLPPRDPGLFSENSPRGACPRCGGSGLTQETPDQDDPNDGELQNEPQPCSACHGSRLQPDAHLFKLCGAGYSDYYALPTSELAHRLPSMLDSLSELERDFARPIAEALGHRLTCLQALGLGYLASNRAVNSLSGGEAQRVRLARQLGSRLVGALYVIDEPTVGLHPSDAERVLAAMRQLVANGNTVLVISHDAALLRTADHIIELGPGPAALGGRVIAVGAPQALARDPASLTGPYLGNSQKPSARPPGEAPPTRWLTIEGACVHNLKDLDVKLPLGRLVAFTGRSGSGKSSLVLDTIVPAVRAHLRRAPAPPGARVAGLGALDKVIYIDQKPVGRHATSTPATYTGLFTELRTLFGQLPDARARGFKAARFSFNATGGRCAACKGAGHLNVEMYLLPDQLVPCEVCGGKRFNRETLAVKYRGYSIADVLDLSVDDAEPLFSMMPKMSPKLLALQHVGLGHLPLGQPTATLSGGEAQRLKLATELAKTDTGNTLYVLDEPTAGLHMREIDQVVEELIRLRDRGNSVFVVEHHPRVIGRAEWIVELGPGAGTDGGKVLRSAAQPSD